MPVGSIVRLQPGHLAQLEDLLCRNHLPTQDCVEQAQNFYGIFDRDMLIAAGGLEPAADYALLRSVVVMEQYRGSGLARKISAYLISQKLGFSPQSRAEVPAAIAQTRHFSALCPDSASCLVMQIPR
jgi:amino-acid N-acetyltransferase